MEEGSPNPNFNSMAELIRNIKQGEEIVISGISGTFPNAENIHELKENLFNKFHMPEETRWKNFTHPEIPKRTGLIPNIEKYDAGYFGVHARQADTTDSMCRILQQKSIEAILDAGLHPSDLENTKTGVYIGNSIVENEAGQFLEDLKPNSYSWTGTTRSMQPHRLSYFLKLKGPSMIVDTACSSSLYALEQAFRALMLGEIDNAIVAGTNLCLNPVSTLQFAKLGVLSMDASCNVFDKTGNGYVRSEAIGVILLQRLKNAKRSYARVINSKTNCDGYKEKGITYPSRKSQAALLAEFYKECNIEPNNLSYLEAHGTGTAAGDPEECSAIDTVLTKNQTLPLLIGSIKSNIGHTEPASGICGIIKCILALETGFIAPNINYNTPRENLRGIIEKRMRVVVDKMRLEDNDGRLVAVNNFGFGGVNCHVLLHGNSREKNDGGLPQDNLPRLVCVSGRSETAVITLLDELKNNELDVEHIHLLYNIFRKNIQNHTYRGFTILSKSEEITRSQRYFSEYHKPLYFIFGELNNWCEIGNNLMDLPVFATSIQRIQKLLLDKVIDLPNILLNKTHDAKATHTHILGGVAVQIGIIDILNLLEIRPTDCIGFSFGTLAAAYFDESLTLEEIISCTCIINEYLNMKLSKSNDGNNTVQANDPVNGNDITNGDIILNYNDANLDSLRTTLKTSNSNNIQAQLQDSLRKVLHGQSYDKSLKNKFRFADYLIKALKDNVFQKSDIVKLRSVILKVSSDRTYEDVEDFTVISLTTAGRENYLVGLLESLGSLYKYGYNPQIEKLYPSIDVPVSRGTRMISSYIKWNHGRDWSVPIFCSNSNEYYGSRTYRIQIADPDWSFLTGHIVDGRNLFPATGCLYMVWKTLASIHGLSVISTKVTFDDCKFIRATTILNKSNLQFGVTIQKGTGKFEVMESDSVIVTGRVSCRLNEIEDMPLHQPDGLSDAATFPLKKKDVYKELRLRGYNYKGEFRAMQGCDITFTWASIKWSNNWITFMDNMLQMNILQFDSRLLYVPTYMAKLTIDPIKHIDFINREYGSKNKKPCLSVFNDHLSGIISCGNIKFWGLVVSSVPRRKHLATPVLETYKFVPNITNLETPASIRVIMQIILENTLASKIKVVELIDDCSESGSILSPAILTVLQDQLLIQPSVKILSKICLDVNIEVEDKPLHSESSCSLVIATNILGRPDVLKDASKALKEKGFIISRESRDFNISNTNHVDIQMITVHRTTTDSLILFQKRSPSRKIVTFQVSSSNDFSWVPKLKNIIDKRNNEDLVLYSDNEPNSGILGFVNSLRRELTGLDIRCIFIMDKGKKFVQNDPQFAAQLKKNMAFNVYKNGQWGTYRHVLLDELNAVKSEHCFINVTVRGDLSSIRWIEGPLRHDKPLAPENKLVYIYYGSLNFKDVMIASGKMDVDFKGQDRIYQECVLGYEFSGRDENGNRVMGVINCGSLSTLLLIDPALTFKVPDAWSLEEAATVPLVYLTVIYALKLRGQMQEGESILIHCGSGGIGLAAIRLALHHGCIVFTTVGTRAKRDFLKKTFPQLHDDHIGCSRDESFEQMVFKDTNGRGVDMVLNSLSEDKLLASVRCLAKGGRFLEIGKFDMANNKELNLLFFEKCASFHGIMLDAIFKETSQEKMTLCKFISEGIISGVIKPLSRIVFKSNEVEQACRFMAKGKHMGKVLIEVRNPENDITSFPPIQKFHCVPRYWCDPEMVYIIVGGLGGFGLELADWLVLRGATKLVLTSRNGISNGYQNYRIRTWRSYGTIINISKSDITTKSGCQNLIEESQKLGAIDAIFNLAVILNDAIFENQTPENFHTTFAPKALATQYLDELTRTLCPNLRHFVVFSSVVCGRGNAGQTNYGMANSVMERICENRKRDGYPALAIEWGAIGEVGLVAEMQENMKSEEEIKIGGSLQQNISNCLDVLERFLKQNKEVVVSSMVVADIQAGTRVTTSIVDVVINVLGIDVKYVNVHSTLAELGMDSLTAVEIKQTLERDFDVTLTTKAMRTMTLARLNDIQLEIEGTSQEDATTNYNAFKLDAVFRSTGSADESQLYKILKPNTKDSAVAPTLILFPGIGGLSSVFEPLAAHLNAHAVCVQYTCYSDTTDPALARIVNSLVPIVEKYITKEKPFKFLAYSYGVLIALEIVYLLEFKGYTGEILCLDGSPLMVKEMFSKNLNVVSHKDVQNAIMYQIMCICTSREVVSNYKEKIFGCKTWDERLDLLKEITKDLPQFNDSYKQVIADGLHKRIKDVMDYKPSYEKLKSKVKLFKSKEAGFQRLPDDYGLSSFFENPVEVQTFEGDHMTLLNNELLAETINAFIREDD